MTTKWIQKWMGWNETTSARATTKAEFTSGTETTRVRATFVKAKQERQITSATMRARTQKQKKESRSNDSGHSLRLNW